MSSVFGDLGMGFGHHDPFMAITDGRRSAVSARPSHNPSRSVQQQQMAPFGMFDMFSGMNRMMADMHQNFGQLASNPNAHTYSHSSFTSYSNTGGGAPNIYQATSSTRQAPGGIKETRRSVRDSASGVEKMAVGHHINDRSHTIKKSRNARSNDTEEEQEFVNLDESDSRAFDEEWQAKTRHHRTAVQDRTHSSRRRHTPAICDGKSEPQSRKRTHKDHSDGPKSERHRVRIHSQPKY
ncbi:myeloid leukemia factor 2-like isoform X2 [Anneissia japonica]|uniref:myeloid leukemia factor 2-like isoform X2 n=1 Tax=Anneissia japonica TaxID=1529436 RepID=UPI0014256E95|nr:myeloid leukemia factor 2-like isoform X2 [Anneissia japonica]